MKLKSCRYKVWCLSFYLILRFLIALLPHSSCASEIDRPIINQKNSFQSVIDFALDLALKKYDGQKVWLIYSIESTHSLKVHLKPKATDKAKTTLKQIIFGKDISHQGIHFASREKETYENVIYYIPYKYENLSKINQPGVRNRNQQNNSDSELAIILDYSFESGNPCLYHISSQKMDQPFRYESRPVFWLGNAFDEASFFWLKSQFQQTKYLKLRREIISTMETHDYSSEVAKFQRQIIFGNYSPALKDDGIEWLGHHDSLENIKILTYFALKAENNHFRKKAIFALSQIKNSKAFDIIAALAKKEKNRGIRQTAIFWLSQNDDEDSIGILEEILEEEKDKKIKEHILFAISHLPEGKSAPILSRIAKTSSEPQLRNKAMFWLNQTKEQRMFNFFLDLSNEEKSSGSN